MGQNVNTRTETDFELNYRGSYCPAVGARTALQQLRGTLGPHAFKSVPCGAMAGQGPAVLILLWWEAETPVLFAWLHLFLRALQCVLGPQWERTLSTACNAAPWPPTPQPIMTRS